MADHAGMIAGAILVAVAADQENRQNDNEETCAVAMRARFALEDALRAALATDRAPDDGPLHVDLDGEGGGA